LAPHDNDNELVLEANGTLEVLDGFMATDRVTIWTGDLDRDGKVDLLLDYPGDERSTTLFLSSRAKPGQLFDEAARCGVPGD
jgi:hypothetical protein